MNNKEIYTMTEDDLKILKKSILKVKRLKIFKELQSLKEKNNEKENISKVA